MDERHPQKESPRPVALTNAQETLTGGVEEKKGVKEQVTSSSSDTDGPEVVDSSDHEPGPEQDKPHPGGDSALSQPYRTLSSSRVHTACVVARADRRGLLASFAFIPEVERPVEYKNKTKWMITTIVALAAAGAPFGSGIFLPALELMADDLHTSPTITNLAVALYMLAMSIFPLWWSSFSETLGRRTIYIASFTLFVVFSVLSAVSVNTAMLVIMRLLAGGASASVQAVGAGTIADIWKPAERGRAMGIFYLGPLIGPLLSPIIGGALSQGFGWRSTMWFLAIYGSCTLILIIFALPETLTKRKPLPPPPAENNELKRVSTRQSVAEHSKRVGAITRRFIIEPLEVLLYLRYPPVLVSVYSAAIAFGALFILNISIQTTFHSAPYGYSTIIVGLLYLPSSLGYIVASLFGGRWTDKIMMREARNAGRYDADGNPIFLPEDRMRENIWLAASMYPAAMVWFGWTAQHGVYWIVPCVANFFFGCGSMLVFGAVTTMLTEFMPHRSSSGVAVNNFVRNIFSCVGTIVAQPLINAMGIGWLCTMIGLFAWVTGNLAIWLLKRNAAKWRESMDNALNTKT
ncbi:MFS general substrate transporter [Neurospora crassa]|uniref:MFS multidrug resistance transporter n=2 Tax=Neurospora crassa TaxID=5141 RepID=Q1K6U3_NEUCR|nr:MFS multidrug resistance transporter [Neurospora crassa OR74A]EAA31598.1 MFS multidrug resistance transporter [Neurospora crassa OR74A]KHE79227.1 MFS general substrate transporter [Neurospora crassa]CAD70885.1 related to dityrosine transporter [Neurospora crassa]|eukprot:XP_960834.1 MFS multidrug resistance transporter [Neurospora crassa OR74A]